jgi:hypothetical protein
MSFVLHNRQSLDGSHPNAGRRIAPRRLRVRALAGLRRSRIDRHPADLLDAGRHRESRARAWLITRRSARVGLARALESILVEAECSRGERGAGISICHAEIEVAHDAIARLAQRLRDPSRVRPTGVVLARRLLADTTGPLYVASSNDELYRRVRRIADALD